MTSSENLRAALKRLQAQIISLLLQEHTMMDYGTTSALHSMGQQSDFMLTGFRWRKISTTPSPETTNTLPVRVGANSQSANRFFTGNIDKVRIWNRALSAQEVVTLNGIFNMQGKFCTCHLVLILPSLL